jgi:hypothetical protein
VDTIVIVADPAAMTLSSVFVIWNRLRLRRFAPRRVGSMPI